MSEKADMRAKMLARRKARHADAPDMAANALAAFATEISDTPRAIAAYLPMGSEIDPRPLMAALATAGHELCLPYCAEIPAPMRFRAYDLTDELEPDGQGIDAPSARAREVIPDIVLLPLLGFDGRGHRLGRGGGFYDRTLAALRREKPIAAIGLAYAAQRLDICPIEPHDEPLMAVLTETGLTRFDEAV